MKGFDIFNKKKVIKLKDENKSLRDTILRMSQEIAYLKSELHKNQDKVKDLEFTLKNRRQY
tara:strand:+ start:623 stop:805 length:183 start_codon:yes stop_codon:yes gene_type:complete